MDHIQLYCLFMLAIMFVFNWFDHGSTYKVRRSMIIFDFIFILPVIGRIFHWW